MPVVEYADHEHDRGSGNQRVISVQVSHNKGEKNRYRECHCESAGQRNDIAMALAAARLVQKT